MNIAMQMALLILGLVMLVKGADFFVEGGGALGKKFKISPVIIGATIIAAGTSLPELAVSVTASINGGNCMAISNVIGSNLFNGAAIIGICALIRELEVDKKLLERDMPFQLALTVLMVSSIFLEMKLGEFSLGRVSGMGLLVIFFLYLIGTINDGIDSKKEIAKEENKCAKEINLTRNIALLILGCMLVIFGGDITVDAASSIAKFFGMSESLIGLTIVAVGTSLPELVTSVIACIKGEKGIALGNVVGSGIFNIAFILGLSSTISPLKFEKTCIFDALVLLITVVIMYIFAKTKSKVTKVEGTLLLLIYIGYITYCVISEVL